ncbi:hypothetical protein DY000_02017046 [Brassica cretica]|uniref:DUF4283 domain-containing protein n=1 Tax=Brassica cretica TaxID=69181 RepID=A0ABQ7CSY8_BRACR|nr:hypothetical protein DY000_02017046 [Brassica cretica]
MEAPIGAVVESTRIWGRILARATHGEKRKDEPAARVEIVGSWNMPSLSIPYSPLFLQVRPWINGFRNTAVWLAIGPPGNIAIKNKHWQIKVCGEESRG